jgi:hypothetical protein
MRNGVVRVNKPCFLRASPARPRYWVALSFQSKPWYLFTAGKDGLSRAGRCLSERAGAWSDRELQRPFLVPCRNGDAATASYGSAS